MICSHLVNLSLLLGAVLSWGVMWPQIGDQKGKWFPSALPESSMKSLNGYKACTDYAPKFQCFHDLYESCTAIIISLV